MIWEKINMESIKGILSRVSKFGGIILKDNEQWYNPTMEAKQDILDRLDDLKKLVDKPVIITSLKNNKYTSIQLDTSVPMSSGGSNNEVVGDKPDREVLIVRQNCLSHATAYAKILFDMGYDINKKKELNDELFEFAERCESWIMRKREKR